MALKHLQLWGAALPANVLSQDFIHDGEHCVGVVGDWLVHGSMEGALHSGIMLADFLKREGVAGTAQNATDARFQPLHKAVVVETQSSDLTATPAAPENSSGAIAHKKGKACGKGDNQGNGYKGMSKGDAERITSRSGAQG